MISHPNEQVVEFLDFVHNHYRVKTHKLSSTWWGRILQKCGFEMAGIQMDRAIYVNDVDADGDGERDYWRDDNPYACVALVAHELWHVLQKRREKGARWHYLSPQTMTLAFLPWAVLGVVIGSWPMALVGLALIILFALPGRAPHRLRQEAEAYAWNRHVASLMCGGDPKVLEELDDRRAKVLSSIDYYFPTRSHTEALGALKAYSAIIHTEPMLYDEIARTVRKLQSDR